MDEHAKIQSQLKPWEESSLLRKKQTAEKLVEKKRIEDAGLDYERLRNLQYTVEEVEAWSRRMVEKKEGACIDFSGKSLLFVSEYIPAILNHIIDYATAHLRKYNRLLKGIKVDDQHSEEPIAPISTDLIIDKAEPEKVAEMVKDLEEQYDLFEVSWSWFDLLYNRIHSRNTFSRRRRHDPDADVSYINEKNKKFNEKLGRSYDKYTEEIRESFERGTAL